MPRISLPVFGVFILALLLGTVLAINSPRVHAFADDEALTRINEAENVLETAFTSVHNAETSGADVSSLLAELNLAGSALDSAEILYENQNLVGAITSANQSIMLAENVENEATQLMNQANAASSSGRWQLIVFSSLGSAVFLVILAVTWTQFKHRYSRRVRFLRPEVKN